MKREPIRTKTIVGVLTQPDPRFVALVDHGANQRPFHSVKNDRKTQEPNMPNSTQIHRVKFDPATYADEAAVEAYLVGKGYTDFTVAKDGDAFYVEDHPADAFKGEIREVPHSTDKGVTYLAGEVEEATETKSADDAAPEAGAGAEATETAGKTAEQETPVGAAKGAPGAVADKSSEGTEANGGQSRKDAAPQPRVRVRRGLTSIKGVSMSAMIAGHETLAEKAVQVEGGLSAKTFATMLENYNGSMPPGMYDAADAMMGELRKTFRDGNVDETVVAKLATDFTTAAMKMFTVYQDILSAKTVAKDASEDDVLDAFMAFLFDAPAEKSVDTADVVAKAVKDAMSGTSETMQKMQTRIDQLVLEGAEPASKAATGRTIPERKSTEADEVDDDAKAAAKGAQAEASSRQAQRMFGRHAAKRMTATNARTQ